MSIIYYKNPAIGFWTQPLPAGGCAYTLTTMLGEYLREAERTYGQRNMEWTILGIEFSGTIPHVWFPNNENLVSVMLTESAALEPNRALFQLSHEVVHLLEPCRITPTTVFEEGLATLFAHEMSTKHGLGKISDGSYLSAEKALKEFLAICPDGVQRIRQTSENFVNLSDGDILRACPNVPAALAKTLSEKFVR
ncbi:hypothetical protein [Bradyrhizobium erythrophlei]|uniref:Uncharacterized protein n=1 Tax=Bradyrhizobium erythrophlei TaxID=1437360 RepID=A0A1M5PVL4_9BRAD|nr:hypothetical protein [Bradyrhizobium erythrophlei]SHH05915.1 hypothetical protein SAMN05444169_5509 [Bradyrhizobium erythrophlei]